MEKYQQKIDEVLTQALTEKTFSLEIIEKIKSLKDGFEANTKLVDELSERLKFTTKQNEELRTTISDTNSKLDAYIKRESEIKTKEIALDKTNYELDFQKNRANEIKELMMIVFKNPVVRSNVYRNGNNGNDYVNETVSTTTEQE